MPRYYGGYDSADQYQNTAFDPLTGRLNGGQLVMQVINEIAARKKQKQQEGWEVEDRDLNKRLKEAQISNYYETKPTPEPKPVSKVTPTQVKTMMRRLGYPEEAIVEVDSMNDIALRDTWGKLQDHFRQITSSGGRVPKTVATNKGRTQQQNLESAAKRIEGYARMYEGAATMLMANPMNAQLAGGKLEEYQRIAESFRNAGAEIEAMKTRIDEDGELSESDYARLQSLLKVPQNVRTRINPTGGGDTIPPDVLAAAKQKRPDLSDEEIIKLWRASRTKK